jgi:hypothetical protein
MMLNAAILHAAVKAEPICGDFLAERKIKPAHLEFIGCETREDTQLRELVANYRVVGAHAASVERALMKIAKLPKLRFICCGWDSVPPQRLIGQQALRGSLKSGYEMRYEVSMFSEETMVHSRARWSEIPSFKVTVMLPRQSP